MNNEAKDQRGHLLFWLSGALLSLLPYLFNLGAPWVPGSGQFGERWISATKHFFLATTLASYLWFILNRIPLRPLIRDYFKRSKPTNWLWLTLSILIYGAHDYLLISRLPFTGAELISILTGRLLTGVIIISLIWLAAHLASQACPTLFRLIPWLVPAILPGLLILDAVAAIIWQSSLLQIINALDSEGSFDFARQLKAAGIEQSPTQVVFLILAGITILSTLFWLAFRYPKKLAIPPLLTLALITLTFITILAEQHLGLTWKSRKALRMEQRSFRTQLASVETSPGVVTYQVTWNPTTTPHNPTQQNIRPDIFLIILESTRSDFINPETTPFLANFRTQECQPLGKTYSASNATHLSWFSIFNGQIPHRWGDAIDKVRNKQELALSPFFQTLKDDYYQIEVRTVCDLGYQGLGPTNFGSPTKVDLLREPDPDTKSTIPELERTNLNEVLRSLKQSPPGGRLHVLTYDSPHFPYTWGADFQPPFLDYDANPNFGLYPSKAEVTRVKNRYRNALAWTDQEIKTLVDTLHENKTYHNSLIIITGDHGEEFQEQGSWFHCSSLENEQTAVPILIKWPAGTTAPPQASASHLDILPSILDHLGKSHDGLPGKSILKQNPSHTEIITTAFCGITGLAMKWHSGAYTATFCWYQPWNIELPKTIHLDDITGPSGSLNLQTPADWDQALKKHFPDAIPRLFQEFEAQRRN